MPLWVGTPPFTNRRSAAPRFAGEVPFVGSTISTPLPARVRTLSDAAEALPSVSVRLVFAPFARSRVAAPL